MFKITKLVAVALLALGWDRNWLKTAQEDNGPQEKVTPAMDFYKTAPVTLLSSRSRQRYSHRK